MEKKKGSDDASQGRTIFIRNLNFDTTEDELKEFFEAYGELEYAKIVKDRVTERSRGTGFVKFTEKSAADDVLMKAEAEPDEFKVNGRVLVLCMALVRSEVPAPTYNEKMNRKKGSRNLHLARVGMITPGSKEAESLSKVDLEKRSQIDKTRIEKLKDPATFISPLRLCVRNIPATVDDFGLKKICKKAGGVDCNVVECRIMRDLSRVNGKGIAKSRGFGFVAYDEHSHALKSLLSLNNNAEIFGKDKRLIVEFAIENRAALEKKARRLQMSQKRVMEQKGNSVEVNEEPQKKKVKCQKADLIQAQLQQAPNKLKLSSKLPGIGGTKKKNRHRKNAPEMKMKSKKPKGKLSRKESRLKKQKRS